MSPLFRERGGEEEPEAIKEEDPHAAMGAFRKGLVYLFKDFSCWTSTHGIPHIGMANAIWLRLFWILVVVACLIGFLVQLKMLIVKYLDYAVNTETKLEFSERPFPAVTICHLNPWKAGSLNDSRYMTALISAYQDTSADADFGFEAGRTGERQQKAVKLTSLANHHLFGLMNTPGAENPAYEYNDLVISCTYNAKTCNFTEWISTKDPNFGLCQVFNFDESKKSSRAGPLYGLRVVMRTNQNNYLPWTEAAGVVVAIHNKTDPPFPDVLGYYAPPGTASSMGVRYVKTSRKGPPYGTCTTLKNASLPHYKGKYEVEACFRSCLQQEIITKCGCYDPTYPFGGGAGTPSCFGDPDAASQYASYAKNLQCIDDLSNTETSDFNLINDCADCKQPCEVQTYSVTVSTAQWPSNEYKPSECTASNQTGQPWIRPNEPANEQKCLDWYKMHTLLVEIYYERMNYQVLTESPAYTLVNLVSDIGGQVGLFLGMSIISVIELITLFILLCWYCASHKSRRDEMAGIDKTKKEQQKNTEDLRLRTNRNKGNDMYGDTRDAGYVPPVHD